MKVKIRRLNPETPLPKYESKEAAGFDIAAAEDKEIKPKEVALIGTGLIVECPEGYFMAIAPRSSTPRKFKITFPHSIGILDRDYSGPEDEILIQAYNFTEETIQIKKGDRIAQGVFLPVLQIEWEEVDSIRNESRGGFGSTGH